MQSCEFVLWLPLGILFPGYGLPVKGSIRGVDSVEKSRCRMANFLNPPENCRPSLRRRMSLFLCQIASRAYEIFMNRSGLPDAHFAMLILAVERFVPSGP
jgi:hypothetical protein